MNVREGVTIYSIIVLIKSFFIAFGVIMGGSFFGGLGAFFVKQPPMDTILDIADSLKIWAIVAALGGTFDSFEKFESGLFGGDFYSLIKQIVYIVVALAGAYTGQTFIHWLIKGEG